MPEYSGQRSVWRGISRHRTIFVSVLGLTVLAVTIWVGYPRYVRWTEKRLLQQAQTYLEKGDLRPADLCLRQVLQKNPRNLGANRAMAQLAEATRSPVAVTWWDRVVHLQPTLENRIALARSAARENLHELAEASLTAASAEEQATALYHQAAAALALATNGAVQAGHHFQECVRYDPTNQVHELNVAVVNLASQDPSIAALARGKLAQLRAQPGLQPLALRSLLRDAIRRRVLPESRALSEELIALEGATFDDRLTHLNLLKAAQDTNEVRYYKSLEESAVADPGAVYLLARWLIQQGRSSEAITWIKTLDVQDQLPVPVALADCYLASKEWSELESNLNGQEWGMLEYLRHALLTKTFREQGNTNAAPAEWKAAVNATQNRRELLTALAYLARTWGWSDETADLLWSVVRQYPREQWAEKSLFYYYTTMRDTKGMQDILKVIVERHESDLTAKNNLATVCQLRSSELTLAHELAKEVYEASPTNQSFTATYAYSRYLQGEVIDALKLFSQMSPEMRQHPSIAAYYATVLVASGEREKARTYLDIAAKGQLLPEEMDLVTAALKKL